MVWADEDSTTALFLHRNFKLSASGEQLMLSTGSGNVIDSVTFGVQSGNISSGRCLNGTGSFVSITTPSFEQQIVPLELMKTANDFNVYPNPAETYSTIEFNTEQKRECCKCRQPAR